MPRSNKRRGMSQQDSAPSPTAGQQEIRAVTPPQYQSSPGRAVTPPQYQTYAYQPTHAVPVYQAPTPPGPVQLSPSMMVESFQYADPNRDVISREEMLAAQGLRYSPRIDRVQVLQPGYVQPTGSQAAESMQAAKSALQETRSVVASQYQQLKSELEAPAEPEKEEVKLEEVEAEVAEGVIARKRAAAVELLGTVQQTATERLSSTKQTFRDVLSAAQTTTVELGHKAKDAAGNRHVQATAAGAAGGAVVLGTGGATTGFFTGMTVGGLVGLVPAIFTFGLSIPVGAAIGAGTGLAVGSTVGGTAGVVGGGAAGYGVYAKRAELREGAQQTLAKVTEGADFVKCRAAAATGYVKEKATLARVRIVGGGTGGTEALD